MIVFKIYFLMEKYLKVISYNNINFKNIYYINFMPAVRFGHDKGIVEKVENVYIINAKADILFNIKSYFVKLM